MQEPMIELKIQRIRKGLTLMELAKKAGLNYNTINQYERGRHKPRMKNLLKLAAALDCKIEDIK